MAAAKRKRVNVQYRKLDDLTNGFGGQTLEQALRTAMKNVGPGGVVVGTDSQARSWNGNPDYGTMVLSHFDVSGKGFIGEIVRFEPGSPVPLVNTTAGTPFFNLTQAAPPQDHEAMRGIMYVLIINDHVMIVESDINTARLETYLSWFLTDATNAVTGGTHVILAAELSALSGAQLSKVETIVFQPPPVTKDVARASGAPTATTRDVEEGNTLKVLKAAGMDETDIQALAGQDTDIEVRLWIKFKDDWRKKQVGAEDASRLLRNLPEDQLTLYGPGGRQKENKIVKLTYPANIEVVGAHMVPKDVARALYEAYEHFQTNGYLD